MKMRMTAEKSAVKNDKFDGLKCFLFSFLFVIESNIKEKIGIDNLKKLLIISILLWANHLNSIKNKRYLFI